MVAQKIGLSEEDRRSVVSSNDRLYRMYNRELTEASIALHRLQGAPPSVARWREMLDLGFGPYEASDDWLESDASVARRIQRLKELQRDSAVTLRFHLPKWIADHWEENVRRKIAKERARLESAIDRRLTPEQRARWEAFVRGETPV